MPKISYYLFENTEKYFLDVCAAAKQSPYFELQDHVGRMKVFLSEIARITDPADPLLDQHAMAVAEQVTIMPNFLGGDTPATGLTFCASDLKKDHPETAAMLENGLKDHMHANMVAFDQNDFDALVKIRDELYAKYDKAKTPKP